MTETEPEEKKGGKNYRRRRQDSSGEEKSDEDPTLQQVEEARQIRELKKRKQGVDIVAVMPKSGDYVEPERLSSDDPLRLRSGGGLANMTALRQLSSDTAAATTSSIGTAFAAETKRRDEDLELLRYVEEEMNRRRGGGDKDKSANGASSRSANPKAMLFELPDYLKVESKQKKKEENMSSQMLTGIPEVDLGVEAKMKNIEETEAAKLKLWEEMRGKKDEGSDFIPTNYAVNFVQHNRWSSGTSRVAPNVQAAFVQAAARRATDMEAKAAAAAAAAAKVVVQISEPGSEGVGYIPPKPVEEKSRFHHHHNNKPKHHKKKRGDHGNAE